MILRSRPSVVRKRCAGFSLLEVLVSLAVVSLMLGAIMAILPQQAVQARVRLDRLVATEFAYSLIEEYRVTFPQMAAEGQDATGWSWRISERDYQPETPEQLGELIRYVEIEATVWRIPEMAVTLTSLVARPKP
ncbi:prepilin-type N-terminal cleavage/methylation domain-containing protein [Neotabrizicola sp. sgz301269]|uniref:type IV pilus modification PilV family protein n=1 Tax=Neotabrizicola sp. sgz301269 TaxID=3276282 RepID=UPI00376FE87C